MSETPETTTSEFKELAATIEDEAISDAITRMADIIDVLSQQVSDLQSDLADAQTERDETAARSKEKTKAAGEKVAALMAERDEWLAVAQDLDPVITEPDDLKSAIEALMRRAEYKPDEAALKASLDTALAQLKSAETKIAGLEDEKAATDKQYLAVCRERDEWEKQHRELSKGANAFIAAGSRPFPSGTDIFVKGRPAPRGDSPVKFDGKDGETPVWFQIADNMAYIFYTVTPVAIALPTEDVPEQGDAAKPNDDEAIPQAA